jgi:hypothetical protein
MTLADAWSGVLAAPGYRSRAADRATGQGIGQGT